MLWKIGGKRMGVVGLLAAMAFLGAGAAASAQHAAYDRTQDVVYGRKHGMALTLDVFAPREGKNGLGLIWVVSGGWFSAHEAISEGFVQPFLDRGYTVFAVVHGSQPRYTIPEVLQDMHRAVRYIRHQAADYSVDPERLGIYGGSAGGHLSLMQGLAPEEGDADAKDPVERESSRVAAVACFFPPTDFLNYGKPGENAIGRGILKGFRAPFDFQEFDAGQGKFIPITDEKRILDIGRVISPISHVTADDVPTLIMHGDADQLVPIQQAEILIDKMKQEGVEARLVVEKGGSHGWPNLLDDLALFADWFDSHLKPKETEKPEEKKVEAPAVSSRAEQPPRKVRIASAIFGPYGEYPGLEARIEQLSDLVDKMAEECRTEYEGRGLDLAILPETVVTPSHGTPGERAVALEGPVQDRFSALASKHHTYLIAPLELLERDAGGSFVSNAAVLFDREGKVAGIYRKVHPVATVGTDQLEGGVRPGTDYPVFDCDFGKLGVQICWDIQFAEGWKTLAQRGAEVVAWPTASPASVLPAARAAENRFYVVSSAWRDNATVYEPTGMVASRIEPAVSVLVHELDLSHAILGWASFLGNGETLTRKYGDRVGYHYSTREDVGLFWSNDESITIGEMVRSINGEEIDTQVRRNRQIYQEQKRVGNTSPSEKVCVELRKPTDRASLETTDEGLSIRIESPSGIGAARIQRTGDDWPGQVRVRLSIAGLESLQIRAGTSQFEVVVPSQGVPVALITREQEGAQARAITSSEGEVPVIRLLDAQGQPAREVPFRGGSVEMILPASLLAACNETIELQWVDFFR